MKEIRIGIIGCGIIARQHLEKYSKIPGVKVVAACDILEDKLEAFAKQYGIENTYLNYRDLLARDDLDAVDIALHNNLHAPITCEVLKSGKHAYCEKPMAGTWADAKAMQDVAAATGKMLHIQLSMIYQPQVRAAQKLIKAGRLGNIYHVRSTGFRRRGRPYVDGYAEKEFDQSWIACRGALFDMGVYHISRLLYLLDCPKLERVTGHLYQEVAMDPVRQKISGFDVEELGVGFAHYENNLTFDLIESWAIHMNEFDGSFIAGSEGGVRLDPFSFHTSMDDLTLNMTAELNEDEYRNHQLNPQLAAYDGSQEHWIAALRGEVPLLNTAQIALDTMLLSDGIALSHELKREVTRDEIIAMSRSAALKTQETPIGTLTYDPYPFL